MQNFPEGIRSVILESVVTPGVDEYAENDDAFQRALDALFRGCSRDTRCARDFPRLESVLDQLVERLNSDPVTLQVAHPRTLKPTRIVVDGDTFVEILLEGFYDVGFLMDLPIMIYAASKGSFDLLLPLAREMLLSYADSSFSDGLYYSTQCRDELAFSDYDDAGDQTMISPAVSRLSRLAFESASSACNVWGAGALETEPGEVASDLPTLIVAGQYDAVTPPEWGRRAGERLPNSYFFELPGVGHSVIASDYCAATLAIYFLRDPWTEPGDECLEQLEELRFTTLPP